MGRVSFNAWLRRQQTRKDAVGDLARDMVNDRCWPRRKRKLGCFSTHIRQNYSSAAIQALYNAWYEWGTQYRDGRL